MQNCENQSLQLNGLNVMHRRIAQVVLTLPSIVIRRTQPTKLCPAGAVGPRFASPAMFGCPPRYKFLFRFNCVRNPNAVPVTATPSTVKVAEVKDNEKQSHYNCACPSQPKSQAHCTMLPWFCHQLPWEVNFSTPANEGELFKRGFNNPLLNCTYAHQTMRKKNSLCFCQFFFCLFAYYCLSPNSFG